MFLTPVSFLFIQPSAQACHSLSRHIGVPSGTTMHIQPLVPARSCFIWPSALIAMIVASFETDGGAALIARAILAASELPPLFFAIVSCPDFALGSSVAVFAFSWAPTVKVAVIRSPAAIAIVRRIVFLRERWTGVVTPSGLSTGTRIGGNRVVVKGRSPGGAAIAREHERR